MSEQGGTLLRFVHKNAEMGRGTIPQVLEAVETDKKEQDHTVASVFSVGRIYRGRILGKAKVAAYRLKGET